MKRFILYEGDCFHAMKRMPPDYFDSCVTDPPYGLSKEPDMREVLGHWKANKRYKHRTSGFMGKEWDSFVPGPEYWREVYRVLKPGAHCLVFAGTRTFDIMSLSLRMAGFTILDGVAGLSESHHTVHDSVTHPAWVYFSGMPKGIDISKAIDKKMGKTREVVGKRVHPTLKDKSRVVRHGKQHFHGTNTVKDEWDITAPGCEESARWQGWRTSLKPAWEPVIVAWKPGTPIVNEASGARFQYGAKVPKSERHAGAHNPHPTVKPVAVMRELVRLVTPPNGKCIDPFMGSGSTGVACMTEGVRFVGVELQPDYFKVAHARVEYARSNNLRRLF